MLRISFKKCSVTTFFYVNSFFFTAVTELATDIPTGMLFYCKTFIVL